MANLGNNFYTKLVSISNDLGMKPEDLLAVMVSESGINPAAHEQKYNGGGLLGFMPQTLSNLKFEGSPEDFRKLDGEHQLDYVKKMVQSFMGFNGGKPFKSAVQYYIANFVPAALSLPGVKQEDPGYAFLEENPQAIRGKDGKVYSKKYYDIGVKLSPEKERSFYQANPLFHGSTKGAITYGDMMKQVDKNKKNPLYIKALNDMKRSTGYDAKNTIDKKENNVSSNWLSGGFFSKLQNLIKEFDNFVFASSDKNNYLITLGSSREYNTTMEYARILSAAIENYFEIPATIHSDSMNIDIECNMAGDKQINFDALKELSNSIGDVFNQATPKLGNTKTFALVTVGVKSDYDILHPEVADIHSRSFKIKYASIK